VVNGFGITAVYDGDGIAFAGSDFYSWCFVLSGATLESEFTFTQNSAIGIDAVAETGVIRMIDDDEAQALCHFGLLESETPPALALIGIEAAVIQPKQKRYRGEKDHKEAEEKAFFSHNISFSIAGFEGFFQRSG